MVSSQAVETRESALDIPEAILTPLQEGIVNKCGGEVVVRSGPSKGRIYIFNGAIAWVTCDTIKTRLGDVLKETANIPAEDLNAAITESQRSRKNFGEILIAWNLMSEQALRQSLLLHNAAHFRGLLEFGDQVQALFIPQERKYSGRLLYSLEEIVRACVQLQTGGQDEPKPQQQANPVEIEKLQSAATVVPNCQYSFVLSKAASTFATFPEDQADPETVSVLTTELEKLLSQSGSLPFTDNVPTEMVLLDGSGFCLARKCSTPPHSLYGVVCGEVRNLGLSLGMARNALRTICEESRDPD